MSDQREETPVGLDQLGTGEPVSAGSSWARYQDPRTIEKIIRQSHTIAIVGLSPNPLRPSHFVGYYLQRHGYKIVPVNPSADAILGRRAIPRLDPFLSRSMSSMCSEHLKRFPLSPRRQ